MVCDFCGHEIEDETIEIDICAICFEDICPNCEENGEHFLHFDCELDDEDNGIYAYCELCGNETELEGDVGCFICDWCGVEQNI